MSYPVQMLGRLIEEDGGILQTGPFGSQLKQAEYSTDGVPVIMPKDIDNGEVVTESVARVPEAVADRLRRHQIRTNGIVLPRRGEVTKRAFIRAEQEGWLCGTGCIKIETTGKRIWPKFLYYYMGTAASVDWLEKNAVGSTMLNLSAEIVSRFPVRCPDIETQRSIADVLSTYDDLIANSRRRVELLEGSARLLFKEWFVKRHYPGHEHNKIINGVPEGWEKKRIEEIAETIGGGTPSSAVASYWEDGDITWFVPTDITNSDCLILLGSERKITEAGLKNSSARILPRGSILMTSRASVGFFGIYDEGDCCTNQGFISICPRLPHARMYMLHDLMRRREEIIGKAGGTTYKEINKTTFRNMTMLVPSAELLREFEEFCVDTFEQARALKRQSNAAKAARDLLLPRLMDGRIAI